MITIMTSMLKNALANEKSQREYFAASRQCYWQIFLTIYASGIEEFIEHNYKIFNSRC